MRSTYNTIIVHDGLKAMRYGDYSCVRTKFRSDHPLYDSISIVI